MLEHFFQWLANTSGSEELHGSVYAYPLVESVHVWALCLFLGMTITLDLRLVGVMMKGVPVSQIFRRLFPWMLAGFVIMFVSGILLVYAIPLRTYHNIFFRAKLVMLILAGVNAYVFHNTIWKRLADWDVDPVAPQRARFAGAASLVLWMLIVFAGRLIAYNWFDCDKQPQPAAVNYLANCTAQAQAAE
jgi:hypothetical protein